MRGRRHHPPERQIIDAMHPLIGLDDISVFLEQAERMHPGDRIDVWMADIHEHLPALVRMHMDGASTDELAAITGLLMSGGPPMMETVSEYGDRTPRPGSSPRNSPWRFLDARTG